VIEACALARRAIENALRGQPDMAADAAVQRRKGELLREAQVTLDAIRALAGPGIADPLDDPTTLARAVAAGVMDAPQLRNNPFARGQVQTRYVGGACVAVDGGGQPISETERFAALLKEHNV
jgi:hypothetical protein